LAMSSDKEILAPEDKRYAAMCGGDFAALEAMLHDELLYTHSSGLTDTLQRSQGATRGRHRTGRAAIEAEINGQPRSLRLVFLNAWTKTQESRPQPTT